MSVNSIRKGLKFAWNAKSTKRKLLKDVHQKQSTDAGNAMFIFTGKLPTYISKMIHI
jgi:hypothetical protein